MTAADAPVLVTGGAGFIGSHVVDLLLARGRTVVVLDDLSTGSRANLAEHVENPRLRLVVADVRGDLAAALPGLRPAAVIHLAAQTSVERSLQDPLADLDLNLRATVSLLRWAAGVGAGRLVLASSAAVYGDPAGSPVSEDMADVPCSPYGASKRAAELYLGCLGPALALEAVALRLFNVYGPRQDPKSPYSGVISRFMRHACAGEALTVQGDGLQTRDFVYVGDVARALVAAIDGEGLGGLVCNVGTGSSVTIAALAREIAALAGAGSEVLHGPARAGDIRHSCAEVSRLHARLGPRAEVDLREGLRRTLAWFAAIS